MTTTEVRWTPFRHRRAIHPAASSKPRRIGSCHGALEKEANQPGTSRQRRPAANAGNDTPRSRIDIHFRLQRGGRPPRGTHGKRRIPVTGADAKKFEQIGIHRCVKAPKRRTHPGKRLHNPWHAILQGTRYPPCASDNQPSGARATGTSEPPLAGYSPPAWWKAPRNSLRTAPPRRLMAQHHPQHELPAATLLVRVAHLAAHIKHMEEEFVRMLPAATFGVTVKPVTGEDGRITMVHRYWHRSALRNSGGYRSAQ